MMYSDEVLKKAQKIKLLALDVDGVLTDGKIIYGTMGAEIKEFFVQDGLGLALLKKHGYQLAIITGRVSPMVERRANELGIDHLVQGRDDKAVALTELIAKLGLNFEDCAYMGDDLPDKKAIMLAGLGISVPNGEPVVQKVADYVTQKLGGNGAVREVCQLLLVASNQWNDIVKNYS